MDELDAKIIATLRQNGRASNAGIARSAGVSEGTVRRRLRRLIDEEHIFVAAIPNPAMMGNPFEALNRRSSGPRQSRLGGGRNGRDG